MTDAPILGDVRGLDGAEEVWDGDRWIPLQTAGTIRYPVQVAASASYLSDLGIAQLDWAISVT